MCGSLLGPPLDGIHTNVGLLHYDSLPLDVGALSLLRLDTLTAAAYTSAITSNSVVVRDTVSTLGRTEITGKTCRIYGLLPAAL